MARRNDGDSGTDGDYWREGRVFEAVSERRDKQDDNYEIGAKYVVTRTHDDDTSVRLTKLGDDGEPLSDPSAKYLIDSDLFNGGTYHGGTVGGTLEHDVFEPVDSEQDSEQKELVTDGGRPVDADSDSDEAEVDGEGMPDMQVGEDGTVEYDPDTVDINVDPDSVTVTDEYEPTVVASSLSSQTYRVRQDLYPSEDEAGEGERAYQDVARVEDISDVDTFDKVVERDADDEDLLSVYGRVVRVYWPDPDDEWDTEITIYVADETGTAVVEADMKNDPPGFEPGDEILVTDVYASRYVDKTFESTRETDINIVDKEKLPAGAVIKERSALVEAPTWYDEQDKSEAREILINNLLSEYHIETPRGQKSEEDLYLYIDGEENGDDYGTYTPNGEDIIKELLEKHLPAHAATTREKNQIVAKIKDRTRVPEGAWDEGAPDDEKLRWSVGVENGVIDLRTGELHDHGPEWRLTSKLPVEYDPEMDGLGDEIDEFVNDITRDAADRETLLSIVGHALPRCYPVEAYYCLIGPGGNGKSVWGKVMKELLGDDNVGDADIGALAGGEGTDGGLSVKGKHLSLDDDATGTKITDINLLKKLTGGSAAELNIKYIQREGYDNYSTIVMAANNPPILGDKTEAAKRRCYPVLMPHKFTADPTDGHKDKIPEEKLMSRLTSDEELQGLLAEAVQRAQQMYESGEIECGRSREERWELYEHYSDTVYRFWSKYATAEHGARIPKKVVYEIYRAMCEQDGVEPLSPGGRRSFWPLSEESHAISYEGDKWIDSDTRAIAHVALTEDAVNRLCFPSKSVVAKQASDTRDHVSTDELGARLGDASPHQRPPN